MEAGKRNWIGGGYTEEDVGDFRRYIRSRFCPFSFRLTDDGSDSDEEEEGGGSGRVPCGDTPGAAGRPS